MSTYRRAYSPTGHSTGNPRASTGTVYVTSFDTLASTQSGRSSVSNASGRSSTLTPNVAYEAQPIRKSTYNDGKRSKTEYAVRPRQNSAIVTENRRPLAVNTKTPSPPLRGTLVSSPREFSSATVVREDPTRYLLPSSSLALRNSDYRERHHSTSRAELNNHNVEKDRRDKVYHTRGSTVPEPQRQYHASRPPIRPHQDEEGWSYTGPREQFDRDYPQRQPARRESVARTEKPSTMYVQDRPAPRRDAGPPPSSNRQLERIEKANPPRYGSRSGFDSDPDRSDEVPRRRQSIRAPVLHQHNRRDDGYSSAREEYEAPVPARSRNDRYDDDYRRNDRTSDRNRDSYRDVDRDRDYRNEYDREPERERPKEYERKKHSDSRRKPRSRDPSPERSSGSGLKSVLAGVLGSAATAGTLGILQRDSKDKDVESEDDESKEHKRRRRRHRNAEEQSDNEKVDSRRREEVRRPRHRDDSSSDTPGDQRPRRHHSRQRHRDQREVSPDSRASLDRPSADRGVGDVRNIEDPAADDDRVTRDNAPAHMQGQQPDILEVRTMSPGENEDDRPRRVQLVEPVKEKDEARPRGILKPPRQMPFPEDPNPIREGVAPLKDATKDGIPVNARWTKINRVLVNPEALEKYHERFEEREDYVIVLRVLSREEIQKLAEKTKEIRETREREWQRKLEERKRHEKKEENTDYSEDEDDDDDHRPQLAIEQGPTVAPIDLRNIQQQQQQQQQQPVLQGAPAWPPQSGPAIPEVHNNIEGNYSQNV